VRELHSTSLHRTGSNDCYELATNNQLSSKNLNCDSKSEAITVENSSNALKDDKSTIVSSEIQPNTQPKDNSIQIDEADNLVDNPTQLMNYSAAVRELHSINLHRTGSKDSYKQTLFIHLSSKNLICRVIRSEESEDALKYNLVFEEFLASLISILNYTFTFYIINSFCCNHLVNNFYSFIEGFRTEEKLPSNTVGMNQYLREAEEPQQSRWALLKEANNNLMLKHSFLPGITTLDPVILGNLASTGNSQ
jgi:hypothetical protein